MNRSRDLVLLASWALLGFAVQLIALHWNLPGALVGGLLCGCTLWIGRRVLALDAASPWLAPIQAAMASTLALLCARVSGSAQPGYAAWLAPALAFAPTGIPALILISRGKRCALCQRALSSALWFRCPRCALGVCEYCWEFGRERCRLCETNHIALLPNEAAWWTDRFGDRRLVGVCSLCHTSAGGSHEPQWACPGCGQNQCAACWDDANGGCARCGWVLPDAAERLSGDDAVRESARKDGTYA